MSNAGFPRVKSAYTGRKDSNVTQERSYPTPHTAQPVLFTPNDLHRCLYRRNEVRLVNKDDLKTSLPRGQEVDSYCKFLNC